MRTRPAPNGRPLPDVGKILQRMERLGDPRNVAGMARYGIRSERAYGLSAATLRALAREIGRDHALAARLWAARAHEARLLAAFVEEPDRVTSAQMDRWAKDFDNWAICDGCCLHLFVRTRFARAKVREWSRRPEEFVKRAAFALVAVLTVHDETATDAFFRRCLALVEREAWDERNGVKKAVNWALRQIGKQSPSLNAAAIRSAEVIRRQATPSARWIASDALRELRSAAVQRRLARQAGGGPQAAGR
jgi:3-methyladenine DNA glycosylase AlkD